MKQAQVPSVRNDHDATRGGTPHIQARVQRRPALPIVGVLCCLLLMLSGCDVSTEDGSSAADQPAATADAGKKKAKSSDAKENSEPEQKVTKSQENALRSANDYLEWTPFSKQGLVDQLSSEYGDGYPRKDAEWAVSQLDVDWKEQAVKSGESYLELSGFSRQGLIDQLSSSSGDQYTKKQATYAADKLGL